MNITTTIKADVVDGKYFWELCSFIFDSMRDINFRLDSKKEGGSYIATLSETAEEPNIYDDYIEELIERYVAQYDYDVLRDWSVKMEIG